MYVYIVTSVIALHFFMWSRYFFYFNPLVFLPLVLHSFLRNQPLILLKTPCTWQTITLLLLLRFFLFVFDLWEFQYNVSMYFFVFILLGVCWASWIFRSMLSINFGKFFLLLFIQIFFLPLSPSLFFFFFLNQCFIYSLH